MYQNEVKQAVKKVKTKKQIRKTSRSHLGL